MARLSPHLNLTRKKKTLHARELRDRTDIQEKRRSFRRKVRRLEPIRLVFLGRDGDHHHDDLRPRLGVAGASKPSARFPTSWATFTVIAALELDGVHAPLVFPGATETAAFQTYVEQALVPELQIFDSCASFFDVTPLVIGRGSYRSHNPGATSPEQYP